MKRFFLFCLTAVLLISSLSQSVLAADFAPSTLSDYSEETTGETVQKEEAEETEETSETTEETEEAEPEETTEETEEEAVSDGGILEEENSLLEESEEEKDNLLKSEENENENSQDAALALLDDAEDTDNWMEELSFWKTGVRGKEGHPYELIPEFSPEIHEYTMYVPDYESSVYGYAVSALATEDTIEKEEAVYASYTGGNYGNEEKANLSQGFKNGKVYPLAESVQYGSGKSNDLVLTSQSGTKEYTIHLVRELNLMNFRARIGDLTYTLSCLPETEDGLRQPAESFRIYYSKDQEDQTLQLTGTGMSRYEMGKSYPCNYQVTVNGETMTLGTAWKHTLTGKEEEITVEISYEGAIGRTYRISLIPTEMETVTFETDTEEAKEGFAVELEDADGNLIEADEDSPRQYSHLLKGREYTYRGYGKGWKTVKGSFVAGEEEKIVISFREKSPGLYLEDLKAYSGSTITSPEVEMTRAEELDETFGAPVYVINQSSRSRNLYFSFQASHYWPRAQKMTLSTYDQNEKQKTTQFTPQTLSLEENASSKIGFLNLPATGGEGWVYTLTANYGETTETYKFVVNRTVELSNMKLYESTDPKAATILNEKFRYDQKEYTADISASKEEVYLAVTDQADSLLTVNVNGMPVLQTEDTTETYPIPLDKNEPDNEIQVVLSRDSYYHGEEYEGISCRAEGIYTISLNRIETSDVTFQVTPSDARILVYDSAGNRVHAEDEENLVYGELLSEKEYTYVVSCYGYETQRKTFLPGDKELLEIHLKEATTVHPEIDNNEWVNYRNSDENNGITDVSTAVTEKEAELKWAVNIGGSWSSSCTPPVILGGCLYTAAGKYLYKLDRDTGEKLAVSKELAGSVGFALNPITYAEGMIFIQMQDRIQALDATTLESVWVSEKIAGQMLSPITYQDGYIYSGTWNSETEKGTYFCLSVTDEDPDNTEETKYCSWVYKHTGGFYWAGSYVQKGNDGKDYVIFGSDDGSLEGDYVDNAILYSVCAQTGEEKDLLEGVSGDIRSSIVYDDGYVYFVAKGGYLYRVQLNEDGTFGEAISYHLDGMATASPVVYKGRVYVGVCGEGGQFNPDGGHHFAVLNSDERGLNLAYKVKVSGYPQAAALLSTAYEQVDYNQDGKADGRVYLYFTYNSKPGGIYFLTDEPGQTEGEAKILYDPQDEQEEYCVSPICVDKSGTLYYKNDSGYLMAVGVNGAFLDSVKAKADTGEVDWDVKFVNTKSDYLIQVDTDASYVDFSFGVTEGISISVNGKNTGTYRLNLDENGEGTLEVKVTKEDKSRIYTFHVERLSTDASLQALYVSDNNSILEEDSRLTLSPEFDPQTDRYRTEVYMGDKRFLNVWATPTEEKAKAKVTALEGVERIDKMDSAVGSYGDTRYAVYFKEGYSQAGIQIEVTAPDKETQKVYQLVLLRKDIYPPSLSQIEGVRQNEEAGAVVFESNEEGTFYYQILPKGSPEPSVEELLKGQGQELKKGTNQFTVENLSEEGRDVWLTASDTQENVGTEVQKGEIPAYYPYKITIQTEPAGAQVQIANALGEILRPVNGTYELLEGNQYRIQIQMSEYKTIEETITASRETTSYTYTMEKLKSSDADLAQLYVSSSDNYGKGNLVLTPEFQKDTINYKASYPEDRSYLNVWPVVSSGKASVKVYAVSGVKASTVTNKDESLTESVYQDPEIGKEHKFWKVYFENGVYEASVRIRVTAEDGTGKDYFLELSITDTRAPVLKEIVVSRISQKEAVIHFSSTEKGYYSYQVTETGAKTPSLQVSEKDGKMVTGDNALTLDNLKSGGKEVFLLGMDMAGNKSNILKVAIPKEPGEGAGDPEEGTDNNSSSGNTSGTSSSGGSSTGASGGTVTHKNSLTGSTAKKKKTSSLSASAAPEEEKQGLSAVAEELMERARGQEEQEEPAEQQDAGNNSQSAPLFSWKELSLWQKAAVILAGIGAGFLIFWLVMYLLEKKSRPQDVKNAVSELQLQWNKNSAFRRYAGKEAR